MPHHLWRTGAFWSAVILGAALAHETVLAAQAVEVANAWARSTVAGQTTAGVYMDITSKTPARLVRAATPAADKTEIHRMTMENNIMRMQAVAGIDIAPGSTFRLAPGGYHVMLIGLKRPLKAGDRIPLSLDFERSDSGRLRMDVSVEVRELTRQQSHEH